MAKKIILPIFLLVIIGFFIYAFNLNNGLFWDDDDWIVNNIFVHDFSHIKEIFSKNILAGFGLNSNYYRPFLLITFAFNYVISGVKPFSYHLFSNGLHILNAILIFVIFLFAFKKKIPAFIASLLFLVHPLQVEAVAYISGRGDPMSVTFMLLSISSFIKICESVKKKALYWSLAITSMILAILSRETAVLLPLFVLVFYISFISKDKFLRSLKSGIIKVSPFFIVSIIYGFLRLTALNFQNTLNFFSQENIYSTHLSYRIYTFFHVFLEYLRLIFIPVKLHMERDFPVHTSFIQWPVWLGFLTIVGILALIVYFYKNDYVGYVQNNKNFRNINSKSAIQTAEISNYRIWFFSWSWFFIGLSMVSGIIPINAIIYEHWLYLPLIGFFVLVAFYFDKLLSYLDARKIKAGKIILISILVLYSLFFSIQSVRRNIIWGNPERFYEEILIYSPNSIRILNNLGNLYSEKGRLDDAAKMYQKIIDNPGNLFAQPYYNLANIYRDRGQIDKAVSLYNQAISKDPSFPFSYQNLASIYANSGDLVKATEMIEKLILLKPSDYRIYYNAAIIYAARGNREEAIKNIDKGLKLISGDPSAQKLFNDLLNKINQ